MKCRSPTCDGRTGEHFPSPEWVHMLWTDVKMRALIAEDYPWFLQAYDAYPHGRPTPQVTCYIASLRQFSNSNTSCSGSFMPLCADYVPRKRIVAVRRCMAAFMPPARRHSIQRADASRYFILHKYGGLYADLDYEPLMNFWDHLPQRSPPRLTMIRVALR